MRCTDDITTGGVPRWGRSGQTWKQEPDKRVDLGWHLAPRGKNSVWGHRWGQQKEGQEEGGNGPSTVGLVAYKYEPGCVQVSSDHSPDTMRLLALLLMVGAAGKDTDTCTRTNKHLLTHNYIWCKVVVKHFFCYRYLFLCVWSGSSPRGWQDHWRAGVWASHSSIHGLPQLWLPLLWWRAHQQTVGALSCSLLAEVSMHW